MGIYLSTVEPRLSGHLLSGTSIISGLQIACFNDIHCNFGVHHLEYSVRRLEYLLQVYTYSAIASTSITRTFRLSGWLPAQRGRDNPGSTLILNQ